MDFKHQAGAKWIITTVFSLRNTDGASAEAAIASIQRGISSILI